MDLFRQHFIDALVVRQSREFLHAAGIRNLDAIAHIVEDGEGEVRLTALAAHVTGGFIEGGAFHDQLTIQPIRQVGFDPLADEAIGHRLEAARQGAAIDLEAADAVEFGRGQQREAKGMETLAFVGEHGLGDVHGHGGCFVDQRWAGFPPASSP